MEVMEVRIESALTQTAKSQKKGTKPLKDWQPAKQQQKHAYTI